MSQTYLKLPGNKNLIFWLNFWIKTKFIYMYFWYIYDIKYSKKKRWNLHFTTAIEEKSKIIFTQSVIYIQDLDAYKQTTREELVEWTSALKRKNIPDWLIVVVSTDESKLKSKLLPRSSVFDKIKSDFCNKTPDRLVHHRIKMLLTCWKIYTNPYFYKTCCHEFHWI